MSEIETGFFDILDFDASSSVRSGNRNIVPAKCEVISHPVIGISFGTVAPT